MTQTLKLTALIILSVIVSFIACKKELDCYECKDNKGPIANAGRDTTITLPVDSAMLDGSASSDPDGNITSYKWVMIEGPAAANISNANAPKAQLTTLVRGTYYFELEVTDAGSLSSKDTVLIRVLPALYTCGDTTRPHINARLVFVGNLSEARSGMSVAAAGSKILFAGGGNQPYSSAVDILDVNSQTHTVAKLCIPRVDMAAVSLGNKILFGGGETGDGTWPVDSVDIYDVSTNTWQVARLSAPGHGIAAAAVGTKVLFIGGDRGFNLNSSGIIPRQSAVDLYDVSTNTWSTASLNGSISPLSTPRDGGHSAVTVGTRVYIAGGTTNTIDIYDNATNSWSTSTSQERKQVPATVAVGNKIYWAGGSDNYNGCSVEIRDVTTGTSIIQQLSRPASFHINTGQNAVVKDNKVIFYSIRDFSTFDIYDIATNAWSIGVFPQQIEGASIISVNNTIYVAGGYVDGVLSNKVWKLEF